MKRTFCKILTFLACLTPTLGVCADAPTSSEASEQAIQQHVFIDWVPDPPEISVCRGHYLKPTFTASPNPNTLIEADSSLFLQSGQSELKGNVRIEEPNRRLIANQVTLERNDLGQILEAQAHGEVTFEAPDYRVISDKAQIIFKNNDTTLWNSEYRWFSHHARGVADKAYTADQEPVTFLKATYTTCAPGDNLWVVKANKLVLNNATGRGQSYNTTLYMKDLPVLYLPYFSFPIDDRRKTGFLTPEFRNRTRSGFSVKAPYYLNLAPNYDATLAPYWMEKRGMQVDLQTRYLDPMHHAIFNGEYLPQDRAFAHFQERKLASNEVPPEDPRYINLAEASTNRWFVNFSAQGQYARHWGTYLEFNQVSDDEYFVDFGSDLFQDNERILRRRAEVNYHGQDLNAFVYAQDYQILQPYETTLLDEPYRIFPLAEAHYRPYMPQYPFQFDLDTQLAIFDRQTDDDLPTTNPPHGDRYHLAPKLGFPLRKPYGYITPSATLYSTYYDLTLSQADVLLGQPAQIARNIPAFDADMGLFFDRDITVFKQSYQQTLEPRLYYLYIPNIPQNDVPIFDSARYEFLTPQLFRQNRFSGFDRINDANQVSYALTTRLYDYNMGAERLKATIGQIAYFRNRDVTLCDTDLDPLCGTVEDPSSEAKTSPIVGDILYRLSSHWYLSGDGRFDTHQTDSDLISARFHYNPLANKNIHLGFRYEQSGDLALSDIIGDTRKDLIQSDLGFSWGVTSNTTLLGRWYYDIRNNFSIDTFGGLEYEGCCYAVRLGARHYLRLNTGESADRTFDTEYFLQWIFKGLGSVGKSSVDYFAATLPGYEDRFEVKL